MTKRWFVTGTDTEVGKTVASSALLQAAVRAGWRAVGYKPVASGCEMTPDGLRNSDALTLQKHSALPLAYEEVNPLAFSEPTSPHIVSAESGQPITFSRLSAGLAHLSAQADWVLTEGAGGWFTPLSEQHSYADWVVTEQLPVILVVGMRLGCINHALLTAQAISAAGLPFAGWIASDIQPPGRRHQEYLTILQRLLEAPFLGEIPYLTDSASFDQLGGYLRLPE
ncbi:dethiobiotin synthase [Erwinia sp. V71]|uniref:dethiobiotin synthase n=1 Tax=Erwinia sp. V71 TaxID=3369424 RepID=UPI003F62ED95